MKKEMIKAKAGLEIIEEAFFLLRRATVGCWLIYLAGMLPFATGLLYFCNDMSANPYADEYASASALGMAFLFVWMKCGQAMFAWRLRSVLNDKKATPWGFRGVYRLYLRQAFWSSTGLILLPLAAICTIPLPWIYAFYQTITVLESPDKDDASRLIQRTKDQTKLWVKQNLIIQLYLLFVMLNVFLSLIIMTAATAFLFKMFTGIESYFTSSIFVYFNSTFILSCCIVMYVIVDPLVKSVYLLRSFYGESIHNGEDLRVQLRPFLKMAIIVLVLISCLTVFNQPVMAATEQGVSAPKIDQSLDTVLKQNEYRWRMPPSARAHREKPEWLKSFEKWRQNLWKKVEDIFRSNRDTVQYEEGESTFSWVSFFKWVLYVIIAILALFVIVIIIKRLNADQSESYDHAATKIDIKPDLRNENITADELHSDGWLEMVEDLLNQKEYRLALRACFLAQLAKLADRGLIAIARFKSNMDYERELHRRVHAHQDLFEDYQANRRVFETVWYGHEEANVELIRQMRNRFIRLNKEGA